MPGLSLALGNRLSGRFRCQGPEDWRGGRRSNLFAGRSFRKSVFAYLVILVVAEGRFELDQALARYVSKPLPDYPAYPDFKDDPRWQPITPRMCLSHSTGFPNLRFSTEDKRLQFLFEPSELHSHSGEGIALLQKAIEEVTGEDLEDLSRKTDHPATGNESNESSGRMKVGQHRSAT